MPEAPAADDGRGGVFSLSFLALVATQFFVSLNDNMFRWLVVPIGKELIGKRWAEMPEIVQQWMNPESLALSLGLACFTLPFLVFAAPAGFLADRFSKRNVMVVCKVAEIVVIALGRRGDPHRQRALDVRHAVHPGRPGDDVHHLEAGRDSRNRSLRQDLGGQRADQHGLDGGHHHRLAWPATGSTT